jgi:iron complex transport system substrate-binding protein
MDKHAIDDRGERHILGSPPGRIVSLVPSTTETLFSLGCGERIVGATRFCIHPPEARALPKIGGTKDVDTGRVLALRPDLVIGNIEENSERVFKDLEASGLKVYAAYPRDVDSALDDLLRMGRVLGCAQSAETLCGEISVAREGIAPREFHYAYLIWRNPWMAAGGGSFISAILSEAGGMNIFAASGAPYPEVLPERLSEADAVLLSSEPFPFKDRHREELAEKTGIAKERFIFVDGELCSWHGSRMARSFAYLDRLARRIP